MGWQEPVSASVALAGSDGSKQAVDDMSPTLPGAKDSLEAARAVNKNHNRCHSRERKQA